LVVSFQKHRVKNRENKGFDWALPQINTHGENSDWRNKLYIFTKPRKIRVRGTSDGKFDILYGSGPGHFGLALDQTPKSFEDR